MIGMLFALLTSASAAPCSALWVVECVHERTGPVGGIAGSEALALCLAPVLVPGYTCEFDVGLDCDGPEGTECSSWVCGLNYSR